MNEPEAMIVSTNNQPSEPQPPTPSAGMYFTFCKTFFSEIFYNSKFLEDIEIFEHSEILK